LLVRSTSISAEPGISIAEPLAEVITAAMHVTWIATAEVHAVALCKFLQVNPFGQGYGFTLCDASADVLKSETGRRCDHQTIGFAW
jgi:hypothetical protein